LNWWEVLRASTTSNLNNGNKHKVSRCRWTPRTHLSESLFKPRIYVALVTHVGWCFWHVSYFRKFVVLVFCTQIHLSVAKYGHDSVHSLLHSILFIRAGSQLVTPPPLKEDYILKKCNPLQIQKSLFLNYYVSKIQYFNSLMT